MAVVMMFGRWLFVLMQECQHSDIRMFAAIGRPLRESRACVFVLGRVVTDLPHLRELRFLF